MGSQRTSFFGLAFVGAAICTPTSYIQFTRMDLARFRLSDYLAADIHLLNWWLLVPLPFVLGVLFVAVAVWGVRGSASPGVTLRKLGFCLLPSLGR